MKLVDKYIIKEGLSPMGESDLNKGVSELKKSVDRMKKDIDAWEALFKNGLTPDDVRMLSRLSGSMFFETQTISRNVSDVARLLKISRLEKEMK